MWALGARARHAWASGESYRAEPGQVLPPPVPGGTQVYWWTPESGVYPWAFGGWAGGRAPMPATPGGVVVVPNASTGTCQVLGWWPDASVLHFGREDPDGVWRAVRGGLGRPVTTPSRRNYATNPSAEAGINGYLPKDGNPTLSWPASQTTPAGTRHVRATATAAGPVGMYVPTSLAGSTPITLAFAWRLLARQSLRTNHLTNPTFRISAAGWTKSASLNGVVNTNAARYELTATAPITFGNLLLYTTAAVTNSGTQAPWSASAVVSVPVTGTAIRVRMSLVPYNSGGASIAGVTNGDLVTINPGETATVTVHNHVPPVDATQVRPILYAGDGVAVPSGAVLYVSNLLLERTSEAGTYFDGATTGTDTADHSWTGTADTSTSVASILGAPASQWRPSSVTVTVSWTDALGGALTPNTVTLTGDQLAAAVGQWTRPALAITPPVGAHTPTVSLVAADMPLGGVLDLDAVTIEQASTDGSYFAGDTLGGTWVGTAHLSESLLSALVEVTDADCPLDEAVLYTVSSPAITGGTARSDMVTLGSPGRYCWLTHPRQQWPVRCDLREVPVLTRDIDQGVFFPMGRTRALVVSGRRRAPTTEITFNADSFAERDALLALFDDGQPLLLRAPKQYGYGLGRWWSLAGVVEDREGRLAYHDAMTLSAEATEVEAPDPSAWWNA